MHWWEITIKPIIHGRRVTRLPLVFSLSGLLAIATACVYIPPQEMPQQSVTEPPPQTEVVFYPNKGQGPEQQDRDRYECYLWAYQQTGFDPSAPYLLPHQRIQIQADAPPGHDTAAGAATGAILGAVVSDPGHAAKGAAVGAVIGAMLGAASDAERQQYQNQEQRLDKSARIKIENQASSYRRAMSACLEGKGYTVK